MAGSPSNQDIFDVRKIRRLVELMKEHELSEIDLRQEGTRVQLRRGLQGSPVQAVVTPAPPAAAAPATHADPAPAPAVEQAGSQHETLIKSPIVGTFYAAPDPESAPYVKVGDHVGPETTVCIVEAMKVFNEIPAEVSGRVVHVLVQNGDPVEFGQPLFKVDTRG